MHEVERSKKRVGREMVADLGRVLEKKREARYRIFVNVGSPCAQVRVTCGQAVNAEL